VVVCILCFAGLGVSTAGREGDAIVETLEDSSRLLWVLGLRWVWGDAGRTAGRICQPMKEKAVVSSPSDMLRTLSTSWHQRVRRARHWPSVAMAGT
jgi:hypothetical protein